MKYDTIIWDWNGTLLNDAQLCVDIVNKILRRHTGEQLDLESYKAVFGFPITAYYERIGIDFEKESFEVLTKLFMEEYYEKVRQCELQENTHQVLDQFQQLDKRQFILTAAYKKSVEVLLGNYQLDHYFTAIEGLDNHKAGSKVNRGLALFRDQNIPSGNTVLIGDTLHDYEVAQKLNIDCILIADGHQSQERLKNSGASGVQVLESITQLLL